jgi:Helix-turn-helix domain
MQYFQKKGVYMINESEKEFMDVLKQEGIYDIGYRFISTTVMQDTRLTIEAKGIYAYLCSCEGEGNFVSPSIETICADLCISQNRFRNHLKLLTQFNYIKVSQVKYNNRFACNIYKLIQNP